MGEYSGKSAQRQAVWSAFLAKANIAHMQQTGDSEMKKSLARCHAAGGAVRDILLGRRRRDVDYVCLGSPEEFIQRNPTARKVENSLYCLYLLNGQEYVFFEAPPGREEPVLAKDIARRDFTINALLLSPEGLLRSHPETFADLRDRVIRPASSKALLEDPVRVLRAARFTADLPEFALHAESLDQMRQVVEKGLLASIAPEQAGRECLKACMTLRPGNFLRALQEANALLPWFQELAPPNGEAYADVIDRAARNMDATAEFAEQSQLGQKNKNWPALAVWLSLCHTLGTCATPEQLTRSADRDVQSQEPQARTLGERLRLPSLFCKAGALAAGASVRTASYERLSPGDKVDLLIRLHTMHVAMPFFVALAANWEQYHLPDVMRQDLERILPVKLSLQWRNRGKISGERLKHMRCAVIADRTIFSGDPPETVSN